MLLVWLIDMVTSDYWLEIPTTHTLDDLLEKRIKIQIKAISPLSVIQSILGDQFLLHTVNEC